MIALLGALVVVGVPVAGLVALLKVLDFLERRRAATVARQIEVTRPTFHTLMNKFGLRTEEFRG